MHRIIRTKAYEAKHGPLLQINTEFALIASSISMIGMLH